MKLIVPFNDKTHKLYPIFPTTAKKPKKHKKNVQYQEFTEAEPAIRFYRSKFEQYHLELSRSQ